MGGLLPKGTVPSGSVTSWAGILALLASPFSTAYNADVSTCAPILALACTFFAVEVRRHGK